MNIQHCPRYDIEKIEKIYTEKDGVEVKYVCSTDLTVSDRPMDIFYRATPHPEFGNYYFGLYYDSQRHCPMITNADIVESFEFGMIEVNGKYYYSQSHHDYKVVGDKMIDGGRAYVRSSGSTTNMRIAGGKFYAVDIEDLLDLHTNKEKDYE
jgi:hypothetical protein